MRDAPSEPSAPPLLTLEHVSKRRRGWRSVELVLDSVSFDIAAGEYLGLRGPARSGKTTLLRIAAGIDVADGGAVSWVGQPVRDLPRSKRTRRLRDIAFVAHAQDWHAAPGMPMIDHIAMPSIIAGKSVAEALAMARTAADEVAAVGYVDALPHEVPPDVLTRLALARALVREPMLLIMDDPGAGGSDGEQQALRALLMSLAHRRCDMAMLVASRDVFMLRGADRIMTLDGGSLRVPARTAARVLPFPAGSTPA